MTRRECDVALVIATAGGMWTGSRYAEPMSVLAAVVLGLALLGVLEVVDWLWSAIGRRIDRDPRPNPVTPQLRLECEEMSEEIKPALTAEEWAEQIGSGEPLVEFETLWGESLTPHPAAALALHGQPFGFTWADVDLLREVADTHATESGEDWHDDVEPLRLLAARIAALLPPPDPAPGPPVRMTRRA